MHARQDLGEALVALEPRRFSEIAAEVALPERLVDAIVAARGITEVTGRLMRGGDAFPDSTLGYGWAWDDLDYDYSAPVDELFFNEGFARVTVVAGRTPGSAVTVRRLPPCLRTTVGPWVTPSFPRAPARTWLGGIPLTS